MIEYRQQETDQETDPLIAGCSSCTRNTEPMSGEQQENKSHRSVGDISWRHFRIEKRKKKNNKMTMKTKMKKAEQGVVTNRHQVRSWPCLPYFLAGILSSPPFFSVQENTTQHSKRDQELQ